jgi:hypothetical protein
MTTTSNRGGWTAMIGCLLLFPLAAACLSACGDSATEPENGAVDETELPVNSGVEYGEPEELSASLGGLMRFDNDNLRVVYSEFDQDSGRGAYAVMHKANPELARNVIAPNGTVLVVGEYRVALFTNADGANGFATVSKADGN